MRKEPKKVIDNVDLTMILRGKLPAALQPQMPVTKYIDPNSLCPCGCGLKYKKCRSYMRYSAR